MPPLQASASLLDFLSRKDLPFQSKMWIELLNALCISLPIIAFASPATVFLPVFFPKLFHTTPKNTNDTTTTIDHDVAVKADSTHANTSPTTPPLIEMPPLALTTQMLQCFLFALYAHHFRMWTLFAPNSIGFALGFAWSSLYPIKLSPHASSLFLNPWRVQYVLSLVIMTIGGMTIRQYPYLSSSIAAVVGIAMCTYPLPSLHRAYRERNAKLLGSASMNAAMMTCCSAWVVHSSPWVEYDVFVLVSNAAGVVVQGGALVIRVCIARGRGRGEGRELTPLAPLL